MCSFSGLAFTEQELEIKATFQRIQVVALVAFHNIYISAPSAALKFAAKPAILDRMVYMPAGFRHHQIDYMLEVEI